MSAPARRALVIGEALIDLVDGVARPGGSPLNVAVGLARLGISTTLHSTLGRDEYGTLLVEHLTKSGVALSESSVTAGPTSVAEATRRSDGETTYDFSFVWDPAFVSARGYDWVHVGSLGALVRPGADVVDAMLAEATGAISFDPNIRVTLLENRAHVAPRVERLVGMSDVVKASEQDLAWLYPDEPPHDVIDRWATLGPRLVVATRGGAGATARCGENVYETEAERTVVVDTIGAGDAFMSGLLAGIMRKDMADVAAGLRFAARCAAITVGRAGADPPWYGEVAPGQLTS